ncbi:hypothetical protein BDZ94DRAFT_1181644 [Collybia nuda]|uniref:Arrestin C-terminal-like domain-containing protein n=1 Tax=Collybia nuda TaxID=64659 RepID=A0A9P6CKH3_9AGAR|nr:hypothetical protein BDZ94DRAFT_1181644 [Collybia nuda]
MGDKAKKNPLSIRLTESAVFLRSDRAARQRGGGSRPSMLRGLLILDLAKPTKITSIELELQAKSVTAWPEGIGARRTEVTEEHKIYQASTTYFQAKKAQSCRNASVGSPVDDERGAYDWEHQPTSPLLPRNHDGSSQDHEPSLQNANLFRFCPENRRLSVDNPSFQHTSTSHNEILTLVTPPYSPPATQPSSPSSERPPTFTDSTFNHAAQNLEDFRNSLNAGLRNYQSRSKGFSPTVSTAPSFRQPHPEISLSRRPSIEDVPENEPGPSTLWQPPCAISGASSRTSSRPSTPPLISPNERHGRRGTRFSLSSVSSVLMDAVRSTSPKARGIYDPPGDDEEANVRRGRTKRKGKSTESPSSSIARMCQSKERSTFSKFGDILKSEYDEIEIDGWKEFKKGIYTYPISFSIPENLPATLRCAYGSVSWGLRATVHRPGAFKSKYAVSREVIVITCPTEEDTEDTENIMVERHWDQQLQYLVSVSGRSFYIGGTIPFSLTLMPLTKVKIHRISVFIEERVDYYTHMRRVARTDPLTRFELLTLQEAGKTARPILPLDSDDIDAFQKSPLSSFVMADDDLSEVASSLMGPGPWTFHQDLKLPTSCSLMRITNKNRRSNVVITHLFKCIIRVERGDDLHLDTKTGKRKIFDIVVQTPITIFSCQCNPEWASLPRYSESFNGTTGFVPKCPCEVKRLIENSAPNGPRTPPLPAALPRIGSSQSLDSNASRLGVDSVNTTISPSSHGNDLFFSQSNQYERLISGQESEMGEAPPTYSASISTAI